MALELGGGLGFPFCCGVCLLLFLVTPLAKVPDHVKDKVKHLFPYLLKINRNINMVKQVKKVMQTKQVSVAPVRKSARKVLGSLHSNVNVNAIKALIETETEAKVNIYCHLSSF